MRPDTYVGSCEKTEAQAWVYDKATDKLVQKTMSFVPGLYKIFDEILVNATDNKVRDPTMVTLRVDIDQAEGIIRVYNDGNGIPVEMHKEEQVYVPELIFGHLLTSSNYDDGEKKVTGGRNGYGAKLANIFSERFEVETADVGKRHPGRFALSHWEGNLSHGALVGSVYGYTGGDPHRNSEQAEKEVQRVRAAGCKPEVRAINAPPPPAAAPPPPLC